MEFLIEEMTLETVGAVAEIEKAYFSLPWSYDAFLAELDNPRSVTYVARTRDKVVAFLNAGFILDEGTVNNVAVLSEYRKNGIGEALLCQVISHCRAHGIATLTLEVRKSNLSAIQLYQKHGFLLVGERRNFYSQPTEDALLLTKIIAEDEEK